MSGTDVENLHQALSLIRKCREHVDAMENQYKGIGNRPAGLAPRWSGARRNQFNREIAQHCETAKKIKQIADPLFDAGEKIIRILIDINNPK